MINRSQLVEDLVKISINGGLNSRRPPTNFARESSPSSVRGIVRRGRLNISRVGGCGEKVQRWLMLRRTNVLREDKLHTYVVLRYFISIFLARFTTVLLRPRASGRLRLSKNTDLLRRGNPPRYFYISPLGKKRALLIGTRASGSTESGSWSRQSIRLAKAREFAPERIPVAASSPVGPSSSVPLPIFSAHRERREHPVDGW